MIKHSANSNNVLIFDYTKTNTMKNKNYYLSNNRDRLLEELEYETKNLSILKRMKLNSLVKQEIEQTEYTLFRIDNRLRK